MLAMIALAVLAAMVVVGALWVVTLRNLFRAALSLGLVLLGVAGLFIFLEAEFLGFVQILVYVGAILTLVVFAVMLTATFQGSPDASTHRQRLPAAVTSAGLFILLTVLTQSLAWPREFAGEAVSLSSIGQQLVTTLVLPFEVISLVFVAAMIGAIALAVTSTRPAPPAGGEPRP